MHYDSEKFKAMPPKKMKRKKKSRGGQASALAITDVPHDYMPTHTMVKKFRFRYTAASGAAASFLITPAKLCSLWCIANTTTNLIQIWESCRMIKAKLWATPPQNGTTTACSLIFSGGLTGFVGPNKKRSADTMGMSVPAVVTLRPDKNSYTDLWQSGDVTVGTSQYFTVEIDPNGVTNQTFILDIVVALRQTTDSRTSGNNVAITGPATVGGFYYLALDNNAGATGAIGSVWKPDPASLPTIS